jgi:transcriptional regulator with XRE-family HTH domain
MSFSDDKFARIFGDALKAHLDNHGIEYAAAAPRLGVTKSALSTYWSEDANGKRRKPRAALLFKACSEFAFTFEYNGFRISAATLEKRNRRDISKSEQLLLDYQRQFKLTEDDGNVSVRLKRGQGRVDFSVSLKAAS